MNNVEELGYIEIDNLKENQARIKGNRYWYHGVAMHFFHHNGIKWKEWHEYAANLCNELGYTPNSGNANGGAFGRSTYSITYKGLYRKLVKFNYRDLQSCHFSVLEPEAICVDDFFITSWMSYGISDTIDLEDMTHSKCCFLLKEDIEPFNLTRVNELASKLYEYSGALYGYYFRYPQACSPDLYIAGWDRHSTTIEEYRRNKKWGNVAEEKRRIFYSVDEKKRTDEYKLQWLENTSIINYLRDIYKVNYLTSRYLKKVVDNHDTTLENWIKAAASKGERGTLRHLTGDLYSWYIESDDLVKRIRHALAPSGLIICV